VTRRTDLLELLKIDAPIIQAPMAGVSTPEMAAAVSKAGALGSVGVGATDAAGARQMIARFRERSSRSLNVNAFCHAPARAELAREARWIDTLRPEFARLDARPPEHLSEIYKSFVEDDAMLAMLLAELPKVVCFHFGVPSRERVEALRDAGIVLLGSATSIAEARVLAAANVDALVAQGYEAGGHRGAFEPDVDDDRLGTFALTRLLVRNRSTRHRGRRNHGRRGHRRRASSRRERGAARYGVRLAATSQSPTRGTGPRSTAVLRITP
jgi:nitronate monooxygenase